MCIGVFKRENFEIVNNPKEGYAVFGDMLIKQMKSAQ